MSRLVTKTNEEINRELIQETARQTAENIRKTLEESGTSTSPTGGSKVSKILRSSGRVVTSQQTDDKSTESQLEDIKKKERIEFDKEKEGLLKELEEREVFCPTCSGTNHEHMHALKKTEKGTLKCTDGVCKTEYALVPTDADYRCTTCGLAHKKPIETNEYDECPMCGNKEFMKYDWNKVLSKGNKSKNPSI